VGAAPCWTAVNSAFLNVYFSAIHCLKVSCFNGISLVMFDARPEKMIGFYVGVMPLATFDVKHH